MSKVTSAKTKGRLTKKELKQDKLVEFTYKAEAFYATHQRLVLGVVGGVVVVILGVILLRHTIQNARLEESYDLTIAKMQFGSGKYEDARTAFQKVIGEGGSAAGEAKYFLARIAFEKGNFTQAADEFKGYLKDFSVDDQMDCAAMAGLAATYEAQGNDSEAAKVYEETAEKYSKNVYASQALYQASRIYLKLGQKDKAVHDLQQIRDKYAEASITPQAKRDLDNLE
ncbi:MAG TPA: tetratricopeptide repeat protein [bacterium]|jgi:TolA-binding protein